MCIRDSSTADMQKDAKDLSLKFLPYSLLISILFSTIISLIYAKLIKNNVQEIQIVTDKMMKLDKKIRLEVSSNDEVGELKQQINDLYSTLLRTIDDLEFKNKEDVYKRQLSYFLYQTKSQDFIGEPAMIINTDEIKNIYVAKQFCDMRKQIDGLALIVTSQFLSLIHIFL